MNELIERIRHTQPKVMAAAVAGVALLLVAGIALSTGGDDPSTSDASPTPFTAVGPDVAPTATQTPTPAPTQTPEPEPNRSNCAAISGTSYQSETERTWYE